MFESRSIVRLRTFALIKNKHVFILNHELRIYPSLECGLIDDTQTSKSKFFN